MKISLSFITIFLFVSLSVNSQSILVSGGFEGSNVVDISEVSANNFTCKLRTPPMAAPESNYYNNSGDHYHNWFMLKIENAAGETVNITITNADWGGGDAGMWGRADGKAVYTEATDPNALSSDNTWQKITNASYSSPNFTFTLTPSSNLAWVALCYPSLPSHTSNWISALSGNPNVDTEVVTNTSQGLPLRMLFVTDKSYSADSKKTVLVYGQEHGNEQTGGLACQGLVDFLVSGDAVAQNLLQNMIFIVIPDICPDATYAGLTTDPDNGLGPEWRNNPAAIERMMSGMSVPMSLESKAIWNRLEQFVSSGNQIDFAVNLHQGGIDNWFGVYELADPIADNFDGFLRTKMPTSGAAWVPNNAQGYSRGGWQNVTPSGWPIIRILGRCWEEWRTTAMGYEISVGASANNFLNNMSGIKYFGEALASAFSDYYGSFNKSLTILTPNGGETLSSGATTNVTWTFSGSPGNVRIDCSTDGGSTWQNLISSTADDGNESVTLPSENSNNCIIRISSTTAMGVVDKSNAVFTIGTPPASTITVTYPNGGETFDINYYKNITWTSTGTLSKINIEISIDGGLKWKRQAYGVTNNNSYIINIPGTASAQCLIRVTNAENLSVSDVSNNFFSVQSAPTYPSIEVLSPNGGETITPGSSTNVTWSSTGFTSNVGIRISTDEGANWTTLISSTANDGNENVTMPSENSSKCLIWIYEATTDTYVNQASAFPLDVSDNLFSLGTITIPPPPIANAATNINITSFTANWSTSANATGYYLDVDDDSDFSSPLSAYNDLDIGNVLTYNITGLLAGTNYYYRVRAYNTSTSANSNTIMLTTLPKIDQTITFNTLTAKAYGDASFTISSTGGTSGNPVVFTSSDETVVTCSGASGEIITIINAGVCNIYANQLGNNEYNDAPQVQQTITISPMEITVTTNTNQTKTYGETDPVFSYTTTPSLLNGDSFTGILGREPGENTGEYNIILNSLSAGANYDIDFASDVLTITKAFPVITWLNPDDIYYGTILDNTQLNAASNIDGTFEYSPTSGSLLEVGNNQELSTVFTPTETLNYNSVNKTAYINVLQTSNDLSANGISLYPNPTSGNIKLESEHGDIRQISIFNTLGLKIYQKTNVIQNETINLSEFANGIFIMKIQTENNMYTIKIMKK